MAEQLICNQQVDGSTPFTSSNSCNILKGGFPERPKGADCKSVVDDFAGPNPASPTTNETCVSKSFLFVVGDAVCSDLSFCLRQKIWFVHLPVRRSQLVSVSRRQMPRFSENPALDMLVLLCQGGFTPSVTQACHLPLRCRLKYIPYRLTGGKNPPLSSVPYILHPVSYPLYPV